MRVPPTNISAMTLGKLRLVIAGTPLTFDGGHPTNIRRGTPLIFGGALH